MPKVLKPEGRAGDRVRLRPIINTSSEVAEDGSVLELYGYDTARRRYRVRQPSSDGINPARLLVANGRVAADGEGMGIMRFPQKALYNSDDGEPGTGEAWGTKADSFRLHKGKFGFRAIEGSMSGKSALFFPETNCSESDSPYSSSSSASTSSTPRPPTPNPGCCPDIYNCPAGNKTRIDISFVMSGCPTDCSAGSGWAEYYFRGDGLCPEGSSMSTNYVEGGCLELGALPPECEGGTPVGDGGIGGVTASSGVAISGFPCDDSYCGHPCNAEIVNDQCFAYAAFQCFSFEDNPECESLWTMCGGFQFRQGMESIPWTFPTVPEPPCNWASGAPGLLIEAYLDGVYDSALTAMAQAIVVNVTFVPCVPRVIQPPAYSCEFSRDVSEFDVASCDPVMFAVSGVPPINVTMQNGIRGTGYIELILCTPLPGFVFCTCTYRYHFETVPLRPCSPTMDATATADCVPCSEEES